METKKPASDIAEIRKHALQSLNNGAVTADLLSMIKEDLIAERIAIEVYQKNILWLGTDDPTTRRMLEGILADEEEHADDMADLLTKVDRNNTGVRS